MLTVKNKLHYQKEFQHRPIIVKWLDDLKICDKEPFQIEQVMKRRLDKDKSDDKAREALVKSHVHLVLQAVLQYEADGLNGIDIHDMFQEGMIGLMKASKSFQTSQSFPVHARWHVHKSIADMYIDMQRFNSHRFSYNQQAVNRRYRLNRSN